MKFNKTTWRITFIGTILLAVFWEFYAIFDNNLDTWTLTALIVTYIPAELGIAIITGFGAWIVWHFWRHYNKQYRRHNG